MTSVSNKYVTLLMLLVLIELVDIYPYLFLGSLAAMKIEGLSYLIIYLIICNYLW